MTLSMAAPFSKNALVENHSWSMEANDEIRADDEKTVMETVIIMNHKDENFDSILFRGKSAQQIIGVLVKKRLIRVIAATAPASSGASSTTSPSGAAFFVIVIGA